MNIFYVEWNVRSRAWLAVAPIQPLAWEPLRMPRVWPFKQRKKKKRVPIIAPQLTNLTSIHEDVGTIPELTQWIKDPALLWAVV